MKHEKGKSSSPRACLILMIGMLLVWASPTVASTEPSPFLFWTSMNEWQKISYVSGQLDMLTVMKLRCTSLVDVGMVVRRLDMVARQEPMAARTIPLWLAVFKTWQSFGCSFPEEESPHIPSITQ